MTKFHCTIQLLFLLPLFLLPVVQGFVPFVRQQSLLQYSTRLRDSEKPDANFEEIVLSSNAMNDTVPAHLDPFKVSVNHDDKELWYDTKHGGFAEASEDGIAFPIDTILERSLDTIEDAVLHARRIPYEKGWLTMENTLDQGGKDERPTVVVLGSGWASHALIKVADTYKLKLIVVSPTNHFVFTPSKS